MYSRHPTHPNSAARFSGMSSQNLFCAGGRGRRAKRAGGTSLLPLSHEDGSRLTSCRPPHRHLGETARHQHPMPGLGQSLKGKTAATQLPPVPLSPCTHSPGCSAPGGIRKRAGAPCQAPASPPPSPGQGAQVRGKDESRSRAQPRSFGAPHPNKTQKPQPTPHFAGHGFCSNQQKPHVAPAPCRALCPGWRSGLLHPNARPQARDPKHGAAHGRRLPGPDACSTALPRQTAVSSKPCSSQPLQQQSTALPGLPHNTCLVLVDF